MGKASGGRRYTDGAALLEGALPKERRAQLQGAALDSPSGECRCTHKAEVAFPSQAQGWIALKVKGEGEGDGESTQLAAAVTLPPRHRRAVPHSSSPLSTESSRGERLASA